MNNFHLDSIFLTKSSLWILNEVAVTRLRENTVRRLAPSACALGFEENARLLRLNKTESKQRLWYKKLYMGELTKKQKTTSMCGCNLLTQKCPKFSAQFGRDHASQYQFQETVTVSHQQWPVIKVSFMCEVTSKYRIWIGCLPVQISSFCIITILFPQTPSGKKMHPFSN